MAAAPVSPVLIGNPLEARARPCGMAARLRFPRLRR